MADGYRYDPIRRRYIGPDGKVVSRSVIRALRDTWADLQAEVMREYADKVGAGLWSLAQFETAARLWLGETVAAGYQLGRGGSAMMTPDDAFELARLISEQARKLEMLIADKQTGRLTPAQFGAYAEAHAGAAVQAFEVANSDGLDLPTYPADGSQDCWYNCRCFWSIEEFDDRYEATWVTVGDENVCPTCEANGDEYNPYVQDKGV